MACCHGSTGTRSTSSYPQATFRAVDEMPSADHVIAADVRGGPVLAFDERADVDPAGVVPDRRAQRLVASTWIPRALLRSTARERGGPVGSAPGRLAGVRAHDLLGDRVVPVAAAVAAQPHAGGRLALTAHRITGAGVRRLAAAAAAR
jgi:hypothetical protein